MKRPSLKFQPKAWMSWLVPAALLLILLALAAVLAIIILSIAGVTPG